MRNFSMGPYEVKRTNADLLIQAPTLIFKMYGQETRLICVTEDPRCSADVGELLHDWMEERSGKLAKENSPETRVINQLKDFLKDYERRSEKRGKVGHIPHMRVHTKSIRNKIYAKGRNASNSKRDCSVRTRFKPTFPPLPIPTFKLQDGEV
jgi:hypothetical protein